jgi:LmbE family N-acetylglucosaminyl deacetylase
MTRILAAVLHRAVRAIAAAAVLCAVPLPSVARPASAQPVIEADGAAALGVALRRPGATQRVLMIGAHPDDENTALLAELALGDGADVAYLSLTRGEGGQNLIGAELQEALGLIRSEELLAARRLDGAQQFFTRAYDFGFSRTLDESLRHWPRNVVLADVVEVVRRYRPDIIVSVFSGTPADGHGHHQAAGVFARDAFTAAADAAQFTDQLRRGLEPHAAHYLFQVLWRPPADPPLVLETGVLDPLFGRSRYQIAMRSRSRHRSQDMGQAEAPGPQRVALRVLDGAHPAAAASLFAGLDTTLSQRARSAGAAPHVVSELEAYERSVRQLRSSFNPLRAHELVEPLGRALLLLRGIEAPAALRFHIAHEVDDVAAALRQAAGLVLDVSADTPMPVAGESFELTLSLWNGGSSPLRLRAIGPVLPAGWTATSIDDAPPATTIAEGTLVRHRFRVDVPPDATPTEPYFLRAPRDGSVYVWAVDDSLRGAAFEPAAVRAEAHIALPAALTLSAAATYVTVDKMLGELRRPLIVVDAVDLLIEPRTLVLPASRADAREVAVTVRSLGEGRVSGTLHVEAPAGYRVDPSHVDVAIDGRDDARVVRFAVRRVAADNGTAASAGMLRARFETARRTYDRGFTLIDYAHIQPHPLYRSAETRVASFDVAIAPGLHIGYIEGAGDDGAQALRQLGAAVELLDASALAGADLSVYDAIVAGIRAYEVRPDLLAHNQRLLDYARNGGTFIVQYNKYELVENGLMPFPATMSRPHGRVTDYAAPVSLLAPEHPLLSGPNRITAADFDDWVQERGLYFLHTFDERYTPLLAMSDPDQDALAGGLVAARVGSGWYVYTGLALFRQLPEAVPGAYRLLANMVSLGASIR